MWPVDGDVCQVAEDASASVRGDVLGQQFRVVLDEGRVDPPGQEVGIVQDCLQERDVGRHTTYTELCDRPPGAGRCGGEVASSAGEFDQHRVEMRTDLRSESDTAVQSDAGAARCAIGRDPAGVGAEPVGGILGCDSALHGGAADLDGVLRQAQVGQQLTRRDTQLRRNQIDIGDLLGDGVLHLDTRVHLDEDVIAVWVQEELHGTCTGVSDVPSELHRVSADTFAQFGIEAWRGSHLDNLLVSPLQRAVSLEEVDDLATAVTQDLDLDVPGVDHRLFEEDGPVTERRVRLSRCSLDGRPE